MKVLETEMRLRMLKSEDRVDNTIPNNNNGVNFLQNATPVVPNLLDENKNDLLGKLFSGLLFEDRLLSFMNIRKGKASVLYI